MFLLTASWAPGGKCLPWRRSPKRNSAWSHGSCCRPVISSIATQTGLSQPCTDFRERQVSNLTTAGYEAILSRPKAGFFCLYATQEVARIFIR